MVRNMVGAVMLAATKKGAGAGDVEAMLAGKDRRVAPMGAPPHGLFLHEVVYPAALVEWTPPG
jgi:tRNA pseudouridine38-40 synthase